MANKKRIKVVIFDFDDTLINTKEVSIKRHLAAAKKLGIKFNEEELLKRYGQPWPNLLYDFLGTRTDDFINAIKNIKKLKFSQIEGASETISYLKSKGFFIGILSSSGREWILSKTESASLNLNYFDDWLILCNEDVKEHKPNNKAFEIILNRLAAKGVSKEEVYYCGDLLIDFEAAKNAGINFIAVTSGFAKKEDFMKKGLDEKMIIPSVRELPQKLTELKLV